MADSTLQLTKLSGPRLKRTKVVGDPRDLRQRVAEWRQQGLRIAFVPTMGALHDGHLSLVRRGLELADRVVASIFVNPSQFAPDEDLAAYPRTLDTDCQALDDAGCHLAFVPGVETLYPPGGDTWVDVLGPTAGFEGAQRPGHFRGVATVVLKLFNLVQPDVAIFGEKDAQQLATLRQMTRDLLLPINIVGAPIVRESGGLAMSSRNRYLDADQWRASAVLRRALLAARASLEAGEACGQELERQVRDVLASEPTGEVDYVAIVDGETFTAVDSVDDARRRLVIAIAVRFGSTRLLDNLHFELPLDRQSAQTTFSISPKTSADASDEAPFASA